MSNILITGCAGFIGSNFVPYFLEKYPEYRLINLDLLTYAGNLENLRECEGKAGETYNIGGRNERDNLYIVNKICEILDEKVPAPKSYKELITFVEDRADHNRRYVIDATKIENELGWRAEENFETGIKKTINRYMEKYQ